MYIGSSLWADSISAAMLSISSAREFLDLHPDNQGLVVHAGFRADGSFDTCSKIDRYPLEQLFQAGVLMLLLDKGLMSRELVTKRRSSRRSAFDLYLGPAIKKVEDVVRVGLDIVTEPAVSGRLSSEDGPTIKHLAVSFVLAQDDGRVLDCPSPR